MAPNNAAVGATRGTSESDELLVGLSKINDATTQAGDSRRGSLRRAMRVATVTSACALVGVVAVSATKGNLVNAGFGVGDGVRARPEIASLGDGRWGSAFGDAFDRVGSSGHASASSGYRLRDGKPGKWGTARGVGQAGREHKAPRGAGIDTSSTGDTHALRSAPALKQSTTFQKWNRAPYEYEMPDRAGSRVSSDDESWQTTHDPRDKVRQGAVRGRAAFAKDSKGDLLAHPKVARTAERFRKAQREGNGDGDRRFRQARLGEAETGGVVEPAYEYEESYENDGSESWETVYVPPPAPPAPEKPPLPPKKRVTETVAGIGMARYNPGYKGFDGYGQTVTTIANDGVLKPAKVAEASLEETKKQQATKQREEIWKALEADGGKTIDAPPVSVRAALIAVRKASDTHETGVVSGESLGTETGVVTGEKKSARDSRRRNKSEETKKPSYDAYLRRASGNFDDYDDAWTTQTKLESVFAAKALEKRSELLAKIDLETRDYDDDIPKSKSKRKSKKTKMTHEDLIELRAEHLMASLGNIDQSSYEDDLVSGKIRSEEEMGRMKKEALEKYERQVAETSRLEKLKKTLPNEDGSLPWDAPPAPSSPPLPDFDDQVEDGLIDELINRELRGEEESDGESNVWKPSAKKQTRLGPTEVRNGDGSVPWDAPLRATYVFNEDLRGALGGTEGVDTSTAWDDVSTSEKVSSFVSAAEDGESDPASGTYGQTVMNDPQNSDYAVAWTVAFHAESYAGDGALDSTKSGEKEKKENPARWDEHYADALMDGGDGVELSMGKQSPETTKDQTVSWNDQRKWRSTLTGQVEEEDLTEEVAYQDDETHVGGLGLKKSDNDKEKSHPEKNKVEFDTRDYEMSDRVRLRADAFFEPDAYEEELTHAVTIPRYATLGEAEPVLAGDGQSVRSSGGYVGQRGQSAVSADDESRDSSCLAFAPTGGPNRDESLCRKFAHDARQCQVHLDPSQSCWHKTVGSRFLGPDSASPALGARGGNGPVTESEAPEINAKWTGEFYACMAGASEYTGNVEAPYRLPLTPVSTHRIQDSPFKVVDGKGDAPFKAIDGSVNQDVAVPSTAVPTTKPPAAAPPLVAKSFAATTPNTAYFYNFVHVPKAGGTYFKTLLHGGEQKRIARLGGPDPNWDQNLVKTWVTKPLVDFTERAFANVVWRYAIGKLGGGARGGKQSEDVVSAQFTGSGMERSYQSGHRAVSKGSLSMGVCDSIDAPCAYLTILRDPLERFMSHYVYSCLEGSEDRHTWDAEWIADASAKGYAQNGCPLSPVEFHSRVGGMINILAPGANPTTRCAVEAAKRNLRSPCVRFLLLDDLEHGLTEMRRTLPDFSEIGLSEQRSGVSDSAFWETNSSNSFGFGDQPTRRNQSGDKLDAAKKKRLEAYTADSREMTELTKLLAPETEVYDFAKRRYHAQWDEDLRTC